MMSSTNEEEDPFLQVQQDVLSQLASTRSLFSSYLRIRSLATTPTSPELSAARTDLESSLGALAEDLADLFESVRAIESDPGRFGLDVSEVTRRRRLVQEVGGEVEDMREELRKHIGGVPPANQARKGKGLAAAAAVTKNQQLPEPDSFGIPDDDRAGGGDSYVMFEQQQQQSMMRKQDEHLDGVFQTVGNLRRQADDIGRELGEQEEMLDDVDRLADRVGDRITSGMSKLRHILRSNEDTWSSWCISLLILVMIILLVLLLVL